MIEVQVVRGDSPEALALVGAMEAWVAEGFGPPTPDRTSTVEPGEMVPPAGGFVVVREEGRAVAGGGLRRLEEGVCGASYFPGRIALEGLVELGQGEEPL